MPLFEIDGRDPSDERLTTYELERRRTDVSS
jgi:hypothetical protein